MKSEWKAYMDYERKLRQKNGNVLMPFAVGFFLFVDGILAMIPWDFKEEDPVMYGTFFLLIAVAVELYYGSLLRITEEQRRVSIFSKYQLIPVKRSVLIKGKAGLLTKFMLCCTVAFTLLNWLFRYITKAGFGCLEAYMVPLLMLLVYVVELARLLYHAL